MSTINKTTFKVSKMDCPSEEQMIRMKLESNPQIKYLDFDIPNRKKNHRFPAEATHTSNPHQIECMIVVNPPVPASGPGKP